MNGHTDEYLRILNEMDKQEEADAKLMKNKNGFAVAYNPQTAVDSETHLIRDFQMTNRVTDHGLLESTMEEVKKALHAGQIPEAYVSVIQDMKVETVRRKVVDEKQEKSSVYGSQEEMLKKANGKKLILQKISYKNHVRTG